MGIHKDELSNGEHMRQKKNNTRQDTGLTKTVFDYILDRVSCWVIYSCSWQFEMYMLKNSICPINH